MNFSVLISVYCKEKPEYLSSAIESIINQTVKPTEIVLVKDGLLTNELDQVINEFINLFPNIFNIVALPENQGLGGALYEGVNACKYDIIARMDSDDIAKSDRFEKQIEKLKRCKEIGIVGAWISEFDGEISNILSIRKVPSLNQQIYECAKKRNPLNHVTVMFRKQEVLEAGNYQPFLWNEDYYLWVRMMQKGTKMFNIQESLVYVRTGQAMFERRGGFKLLSVDVLLQVELLKIGFVNYFEFIFNIFVRIIFRLIPNNLRKLVYINLLRR